MAKYQKSKTASVSVANAYTALGPDYETVYIHTPYYVATSSTDSSCVHYHTYSGDYTVGRDYTYVSPDYSQLAYRYAVPSLPGHVHVWQPDIRFPSYAEVNDIQPLLSDLIGFKCACGASLSLERAGLALSAVEHMLSIKEG